MGVEITTLSGQASDTFKITFEMPNLKKSLSTIVTNDTCPACQVSLIEPFLKSLACKASLKSPWFRTN